MTEDQIVNLNLRIPKELRDAFVAVCKSKDTTASRELREYIRKYIARNSQRNLI